ncbi:hypothetical protein SAMN06265349_106197 [Flavobacterium resistens]|uniref:Uncharacterized protein n=1 Tax=Flavobacterium resistens TaxID=443612 RepID=A0A521F3L3_9FLAO|nr:hypothetical protein SAMN06265349_106197 [Flavobacterium resistens]
MQLFKLKIQIFYSNNSMLHFFDLTGKWDFFPDVSDKGGLFKKHKI